MSNLSKIIKSVLEGLYRSRRPSDRRKGSQPALTERVISRREGVIKKIVSLDQKLSRWYSDLPALLRMTKDLGVHTDPLSSGDWFHPDLEERTFDNKLFRLQALALKLAYENTRILIHRPLLRYSFLKPRGLLLDSQTGVHNRTSTFRMLLQSCRDAALQISWAGTLPVFQEASRTFAVNFVSLHLLTAGVALCVITSSDPLSGDSHEAKLGIRRVMQMQASLKTKSVVAEQGLQVLQELLSLAMRKETEALLRVHVTPSETTGPQTVAGIPKTRFPLDKDTESHCFQSHHDLSHSTLHPADNGPQSAPSAPSDPNIHKMLPDGSEENITMQAIIDFEQGKR